MAFKRLSDFLTDFRIKTDQSSFASSHKGKKMDSSSGFEFIRLVHQWEELVGSYLAKYLRPLRQERGVLVLLSRHPAFSQDASLCQGEILEKIFARFPGMRSQIKGLKFVTSAGHFEQMEREKQEADSGMDSKNEIEDKEKSSSKERQLDQIEQRKAILHPYSPRYRELHREAQLFFADTEDEELKAILVSLYIQRTIDEELERS